MLLLASREEGSPNVVLEVMAAHTPVATMDIGNVPHMLDGGRCSVLLDQRSESRPAMISPLLSTPPYGAQLGRLGRLRVERYFRFESRMAKVLGIYDRLLNDGDQRDAKPLRHAA